MDAARCQIHGTDGGGGQGLALPASPTPGSSLLVTNVALRRCDLYVYRGHRSRGAAHDWHRPADPSDDAGRPPGLADFPDRVSAGSAISRFHGSVTVLTVMDKVRATISTLG